MTTPRPKRHVNRRNASHEPIADYVDPPGILLKPSNLSAGTPVQTFFCGQENFTIAIVRPGMDSSDTELSIHRKKSFARVFFVAMG